ncbi:Threonyl/alanyl tRNA synthetase [Parasitella parasitica]|nr:Threonyl/alanyl tRNA synthetase [Parasitella parasitica]
MQQHSGQHLLSAVLEQDPYNIETISWSLGEKRSFIELPTSTQKAAITPELLNEVEAIVNQLIIKNVPVITHSEEASDDKETRPDSLPKDYVGGGHIRTIEIQGLDRNPCCGTHVLALGQLQCLKLLSTESVRGGNTRVFFLVGQRVLDSFDASYQITRQITHLLSGGQETFAESIQKIQQQSRDNMKRAKRYLEQLAQFTVSDIAKTLETQRSAIVYKEDGDMEFLGMIANGIRDRQLLENNDKVVVLAAGERRTGGPVIVAGSDNDIVQKTGKILTTVLSGVKGGGKGRWQGKAQNWDGIEELEKALQDEIK